MAKFLVLDLDKASFVEDARAINKICKELNITPTFELSKSGNGIHIWFFFETLVSASSARKLGDILVTKAMDIANSIDMSSYDRMFPNQDFVAPDALGNLLALPLQYTSRVENKTVFIDIDTMQPFPDQWNILRNISKISSTELTKLLQTNIVQNSNEIDSLMPWEVKRNIPISFPRTTKAVMHEALYIEKMELSKTLLNTLQRLASFTNPEFYIRQNLRKSTFNTPRIISLFDMNERYVIIPRGLTNKVQHLFQSHNASLVVEDKRFMKKIDKPILSITLRDNQKTAYNKILKNDYALLIAPPGFGKTAIASAVIAKRSVNTLILVHKVTLLEQWAERLEDDFSMILGELVEDHGRNRLIIDEISKLKNRKILVISERIEHLNILYHGLKSKNLKPTLLYSGMGSKIQRAALKEAQYANIILSTSGYIGEGIDFAHLDTIIFTMPISYHGRIVQYLGRVGRRGQKCLAVDFVDENVPMLKSSFTKRLKGYKQMGYKHVSEEKSSLNLFD